MVFVEPIDSPAVIRCPGIHYIISYNLPTVDFYFTSSEVGYEP